MIYQRISLATTNPVGDPGPLPFAVANWKPEQVLDLSGLNSAYGFTDAGFWPVVDDIPEYNPATETVVPGNLTKDAPGKRFVREWTVEAIPITREQVDAERDRRTGSGFAFNGKAYRLDEKSLTRITAMGAKSRFTIMANGNGPGRPGNHKWADPDNDFGFIATDNTAPLMDAPTTRDFADAAMLWVSRNALAAHALKMMTPIPLDYASNDVYWPVLAP